MSIQPQYLVRGADGRPLPPQDLIDKIRKSDARIGLFYTNAAWAITEAWTEDDPRRAHIQAGEMQAEFAFDICGYLPITCSLDEALPYIERELQGHTAESFAALRYAVSRWNEVEVDQAAENAVLGAVSDALDASNIVTPGISASVGIQLLPTVPKTDPFAKARAAKAAKAAARKAGAG